MTLTPLELEPPTPQSSEPTRPCPRSYRPKALATTGLVLALLLFFAWWGDNDALTESIDKSRIPAKLAGEGGPPSGTDAAGGGPGAGAANVNAGLETIDPDNNPLGDANTEMNQAAPVASGNDAPDTTRVLPRIGFTPPDEPPVKAPVVAPVLVSPGGHGKGGPPGSMGGSGTSFMGVETSAKRIVYILDFSGSMFGALGNPKIDHVLLELKKSVNRLPADHSFYVIFFDDQELAMPNPAMVAATTSNKTTYFKWADTESVGSSARGGTNPGSAIAIALSTLKPDSIFLLTDGGFDPNDTFAAITKFNGDHAVEINTVGFHDRGGEAVLRQIALENHGEYRYIAPPQGP